MKVGHTEALKEVLAWAVVRFSNNVTVIPLSHQKMIPFHCCVLLS